VKLATPPTAATGFPLVQVRVDELGEPGVIVSVTSEVSLVTGLPEASSTVTTGEVAKV
jgi:hypothetical protein